MSRVTIDAALSSKLQNIVQPVELCDESGHVLGRFIPQPESARHGSIEPQVSEEELDRRERETESYTTAEVLAYLEKL